MTGRIAVAAACFALAVPAPALAQTPRGKDASGLEAAKALTRQAEIDFKLGRFEASLAEYTSAYQSYPVPALLLDIAQCHRMMKAYERALFFFKGYLRDAPDATNRVVVLGLIDEMERSLAAQEAAARTDEQNRRDHAAAVVAPPAPASVPPEPPTKPAGPGDAGRGLGTAKVLAIASAGVGVVGLGIGAVLGAVALSQKSSAEAECPEAQCPTQAGVHEWSTAASTGTASTVLLVVGGVGIAGGAVLWLSAPRATATTSPRVGLGPGTLLLKGVW